MAIVTTVVGALLAAMQNNVQASFIVALLTALLVIIFGCAALSIALWAFIAERRPAYRGRVARRPTM